MNYIKRLATTMSFITASALVFVPTGCSKIDEKINDFFEGIFASPDGWEIEVDGAAGYYDGKVLEVGQSHSGYGNPEVGDLLFYMGTKVDDNTIEAQVLAGQYSQYSPGIVTVYGDELTITRTGQTPLSFTRQPEPSDPGGGGGDNSPVDTLLTQHVEGSPQNRKSFQVTVPSGYKKLVVMTTEQGESDWNTADLFVRKGSAPVINHNPPQSYTYTWTADCASIEPNRNNEMCTFNSPYGTYHIIVYGYNSNFRTRLIVYAEK